MYQLGEATKNWIEERPFLQEIGQLHMAIQSVCASFTREVEIPNWDIFTAEFQKGVPILKNQAYQPPLREKAEEIFLALTKLWQNANLPETFREQCKSLYTSCKEKPELPKLIIRSELPDIPLSPEEMQQLTGLEEGLVHFLSWVAIGCALQPFLPSLMEWQKNQNWELAVCPTCGEAPVMSMLKRGKKGRQRYLVCNCCQTQWQYKRIGCPYCDNLDQNQLGILEIEEEPNLRLDVCRACNHYLKTYTGRGEEEAALTDWLSIHLDILCKKEGYEKKAALISE